MSDSRTISTVDITTGSASASDRLWTALRAHPGSDTEQLAVQAGVGHSTAGKILSRWVADTAVTRHPASAGTGRAPATFRVAEPGESAVPTTQDTAESGDAEATAATDNVVIVEPAQNGNPDAESRRRLAPGGLRGLVEDYLRDHAADDHAAAKIGKDLGRSSGAVANALARLTTDGYAVMTSPRPKRYRLAAQQPQS